MKTKIERYYFGKFILVLLLFIAFACTENFEEINTPPTTSISIDAGYLLTTAQVNLARSELLEYTNNIWGSWVQHWGGGPLFSPSRYIPAPTHLTRYLWNTYYSLLKNLALIRNDILAGLENDPEGRTKLAMAKIVEIYAWQVLTDHYGPIPYSESGLPLADLARQPKYDSQESIYRDLIADLDVALSQLNSGDESYGEADAIYAGDVELWEKFGNALKLKLGMRVKYVDNALAQATVEGALSSPLISGNDENADVPTYTENWRHPTLRQSESGSPDYFFLAEKFVDVLDSIGDPRLPLLGDTTKATAGTPDAEFKGIKVAQLDDYYASVIRSQYSQVSSQTYFNQALEIPMHMLSYGEVCFFKAEAALEGWGGLSDTDAETFYRDGILAAMEMEPYNLAEADIPTDYIANEFPLTGLTKEEKLEKIMTQKWILLFVRNFEAWSEWRRTGYPVLVPGPDGEGVIPRRLLYPVEESALNSANYEAVVATLSNGDVYQSKVWWDAK